jgi:MoaA/NifB/PqqE/SkfB family radical SAM enzyme
MFDQLKNIHLEITNRCQASCPMCSRNYHGGLENPLIKNNDWTLEDFKKIFTEELLFQLEGFYFCGNFGDPIINDNLIEMCEYSTSVNPKLYIRIHTNGSARSAEWWSNLAKALPPSHNVIFALDGLEDTHSIYRIGTQYEKIIKNAQAFIAAGGTAEWAFIKFKHNEHQAEEAEHRAKQLGFARFTQKDSARFVATDKFEVLNKNGEVEYYLEPPTNSKINFINKDTLKNYKSIVDESDIDCYVLKTKEIYIDAYRRVMPCCFLASIPYNYIGPLDVAASIKTEIQNQYQNLVDDLGNTNALEVSIRDIINSDAWQTVWKKYWGSEKLITCARTCGVLKKDNLSKPKDQFVKMVNLND